MSNTVDVLLIDGPADRRMVNVPRPVPKFIDVPIVDGITVTGSATYTVANLDMDGVKYWVAVPDLNTTTNIADVVVEMNHQPAWDLNR